MVKVIFKKAIVGVLRMGDFDEKGTIEAEGYILSY